MPFVQQSGQSQSRSNVEQIGEQQKPRLIYATANKHNPDAPIEMTFVVQDNQGTEQTITVKNLDSAELFYQTEEGQNWQQQQQQRSRQLRRAV